MHPEETQTRFEPVHVDKRKMPRVVLRAPARLVTPAGEHLTVTVRDVAPDGLQLRCSRAIAARINPGGRAIRDGEPVVHVEVAFGVPTDDGRAVVRILGRLIYFSIIAPDVVAIGVTMVAASKADRARLERFFAYAMRPCDERDTQRDPERVHRQIKGAGDRLVLKPRG